MNILHFFAYNNALSFIIILGVQVIFLFVKMTRMEFDSLNLNFHTLDQLWHISVAFYGLKVDNTGSIAVPTKAVSSAKVAILSMQLIFSKNNREPGTPPRGKLIFTF